MLGAFDEFAEKRLASIENSDTALELKKILDRILSYAQVNEGTEYELYDAVKAKMFLAYKLGFSDGMKSFEDD